MNFRFIFMTCDSPRKGKTSDEEGKTLEWEELS